MFLAADEFPLPWEYREMPLDEVMNEPPDDLDDRTVMFLDCGNIDHHHDNTRFGTVNLVCSVASCTAEMVWRIAKELDAEITPEIAKALYVGLVTDTGRFMYQNTTPASHRMAAELIDSGVEPQRVFRRLFEDLPFERLQLLSRALASVARYEGGVITLAMLTRRDFEETGAVENDSEGIVDHIRAVQGTAVAVLVRELLGDERRNQRKVSLRATDDSVDVSSIARALGGGGHRRAAGFTTELEPDELVAAIREHVAEQPRQ